jgi:hypothetical protein
MPPKKALSVFDVFAGPVSFVKRAGYHPYHGFGQDEQDLQDSAQRHVRSVLLVL